MEKLKKLLNNRFLKDDLKEYGVCFDVDAKENLSLNFRGKKIAVKTREDSFDEWMSVSEICMDSQEKIYMDKSFNVLSNLHSNKIEFRIKTLKSRASYNSYSNIQEYKFNTEKGVVKIGYISKEMLISIFFSELYFDIFVNRIVPTLEHKIERGIRWQIYIEDIFRLRTKTATFEPLEELTDDNIKNIIQYSRKLVSNCFYYLENNNEDSFSMAYEKINLSRTNIDVDEIQLKEFSLPKVNYDVKLLAFYKNAYVSNTSSQAFLSYYHVAEYFFLKCTENNLYKQMKSFIDDPKFSTDEKNLSSMINVIKKHNYENDENKMLLCVLDSFISSQELFRFLDKEMSIKKFEEKEIFGEKINNTAFDESNVKSLVTQTVKIIRNGIVHSTDRYNRGERYTPFTKDGDIIRKYLPLIRFIAEKIIAANT